MASGPIYGSGFVELTPEVNQGGFLSAFGGIGTKAAGLFAAAFAAVGIGKVIADTVMAGIAQEAGVDRVAASLGLSPEAQGRLGDVAGKAYMNNFGESVEENAGVVAEVMRRFGEDLPDEVLQELTEGAQTLGTVFDQDVNEVLNAAQQLFSQGLAPSAEEALDMVAQGLQDTKGPRDEFLSAINEYSTSFAAVGLDGSQALAGLSSEFADNQFLIDKTGDAIKEFGIRVLDGSDLTKESLAEIGFAIGDVEAAFAEGGPAAEQMTTDIITAITQIEDPADRARVGVGLMGTPFEDLASDAVPILQDLVGGMGAVGDATGRIGQQAFDNVQGRFGSAWRTLKQTVIEAVGNAVMPMLTTLSEWLTAVLPPAIEVAKQVFGAIGDAIGTVVGVIQTVIDAFRSGEGQAVASFLNIQEFAQQVWPKIQKIIAGVMEVIRTVIKTVTSIIQAIWSQHGERIMAVIQAAWTFIKATVEAAIRIVQGIIDTVMGILTGDWSRAWEGIKNIVGGVWDRIKAIINLALDVLKNIIPIALDFIQEVFERAWDTVTGIVGAAWEEISGAISDGIEDVKGFFVELPGNILDWLGDLGSLLVGAGEDIIRGLWDGISSLGGWLKDQLLSWVTDHIPGPIADLLGISSPSKLFEEFGRNVAQGLAIGITDESRMVERAVANLTRGVPGALEPTVTAEATAAPGGLSAPLIGQINQYGTPESQAQATWRLIDRELRLAT